MSATTDAWRQFTDLVRQAQERDARAFGRRSPAASQAAPVMSAAPAPKLPAPGTDELTIDGVTRAVERQKSEAATGRSARGVPTDANLQTRIDRLLGKR